MHLVVVPAISGEPCYMVITTDQSLVSVNTVSPPLVQLMEPVHRCSDAGDVEFTLLHRESQEEALIVYHLSPLTVHTHFRFPNWPHGYCEVGYKRLSSQLDRSSAT